MKERVQALQAVVRELVGPADMTGLELMGRIRMVANLYEAAANEQLRDAALSGPRFGLLLGLLADEKLAGGQGLSPTHLSHFRNVSKNTISALLRGLEEQGLIERTLDPEDKRIFHIRLSEAGRELVRAVAPQHLAYLNDLAASLTPAEQAQLLELLTKLAQALVHHHRHGRVIRDP
ncbi:MAG: MarR family winged helix-turn-helix transcriptional regulator [Anaerolineae bacterium]